MVNLLLVSLEIKPRWSALLTHIGSYLCRARQKKSFTVWSIPPTTGVQLSNIHKCDNQKLQKLYVRLIKNMYTTSVMF
jgi:hypothetical protein